MASRGDMIKRGRARVDARRAARNREESMARQGATRFKRENIDTDQRIGLRASIDETPILSEGVRTVENIGKKYLPSIYGGVQRGLDSLTGAWNEAQEARRDDKKWTLGGDPLDVTRGSDAYRYLLTQIDDPEDRKAFRREVGKNNLHWTELNEYAGDNAAGLAKKINEYNAGIRSFPKGEDIYEDLIGQGKALRDTGMIGDAAARIAEAQDLGKAGFFTPEMMETFTPPFDDTVIDTTPPIPTGRYPFPVGMDMAPTEVMSDEERALQESLMGDPYFQENFDPETGTWRSPPLIEDVADSASRAENIAALDRIMAQDEHPMINPPRAMAHPDFYDFLGQTYGPAGMDAYWDEEDEEERRGLLWEPPWNYQI